MSDYSHNTFSLNIGARSPLDLSPASPILPEEQPALPGAILSERIGCLGDLPLQRSTLTLPLSMAETKLQQATSLHSSLLSQRNIAYSAPSPLTTTYNDTVFYFSEYDIDKYFDKEKEFIAADDLFTQQLRAAREALKTGENCLRTLQDRSRDDDTLISFSATLKQTKKLIEAANDFDRSVDSKDFMPYIDPLNRYALNLKLSIDQLSVLKAKVAEAESQQAASPYSPFLSQRNVAYPYASSTPPVDEAIFDLSEHEVRMLKLERDAQREYSKRCAKSANKLHEVLRTAKASLERGQAMLKALEKNGKDHPTQIALGNRITHLEKIIGFAKDDEDDLSKGHYLESLLKIDELEKEMLKQAKKLSNICNAIPHEDPQTEGCFSGLLSCFKC